jgi:hypothetical protein
MWAAGTGSSGGQPRIPSWALDPSGWELAAQLGFSRDEERDIIGATLWPAAGSSPGQLVE